MLFWVFYSYMYGYEFKGSVSVKLGGVFNTSIKPEKNSHWAAQKSHFSQNGLVTNILGDFLKFRVDFTV
jgi:hypothetical protein